MPNRSRVIDQVFLKALCFCKLSQANHIQSWHDVDQHELPHECLPSAERLMSGKSYGCQRVTCFWPALHLFNLVHLVTKRLNLVAASLSTLSWICRPNTDVTYHDDLHRVQVLFG